MERTLEQLAAKIADGWTISGVTGIDGRLRVNLAPPPNTPLGTNLVFAEFSGITDSAYYE
jgi:hypothetical protein